MSVTEDEYYCSLRSHYICANTAEDERVWVKDKKRENVFTLFILLVTLIIFFGCIFFSCNDQAFAYTNEEYCDAIYWAEGGDIKFPYGVRSVSCDGADDCRNVCLNTVRNNRKRFADDPEGYTDFFEFLGHRYAPLDAGNDPYDLNFHWMKNVQWYLDNPRSQIER